MEEGHQKYRTELPKPVRAQLDKQDQYDLKQLRQALRGERPFGQAVKSAAAKPLMPKSGAQDLVSGLANRLTKVEAENQQLKLMLRRANDENTSLRQKVDLCRLAAAGEQANVEEIIALKGYIEVLRQQIYDMELFLDSHGLIYVEDTDLSKEPAPRAVLHTLQSDPIGESAEIWEPPERHILEDNIRKLNQLVSKDRILVEDRGNQGRYGDKPSIPVRFYPNGIFIKRGPFRAYKHDKTAREFVEDIAAGFLPSEFRTSHPDGISIDASFEAEPFRSCGVELFEGQAKLMIDESTPPPPPKPAKSTIEAATEHGDLKRNYLTVSEYGTKHNYSYDQLLDQRANMEKPMSLQQFLSRVKGSCVSNGQVIPMKEALGLLVHGKTPIEQAREVGKDNLSSTTIVTEATDDGRVATLRIRVSSPDLALNDHHLLLKLPFSYTVESMIRRIGDALNIDCGRIRLHRPYGEDIMQDIHATLESAGCTPNARLFVKIGA
ncbi:Socius [Giardia lamblia P15]|uniref:UBX domain-containing protein 11 n=1 Tax=Giardia intestinalis (strain P15) TaxID=658858 RepID=E1EYY5_GIAIA|nr:Socius [Giardia lamblia P15]